MATTIKITQLPSIGNGLTANTILPVVNTTGTAITAKVIVGNIANFTLTEAGNLLPPAFVSTIAYTVANAAQPNITSVGTLTTLTSSGNITAPFFIGNVVGNISGNLVVPGSNTSVLFNQQGNAGTSNAFQFNYATNVATIIGNLSATNISGNGAGLTSIAGANVSGFVPNANIANTAFAVAAANVSGLGNIATINLTGSNSNVLYGNGVFAAVAGGANTGNVTFDDINVIGTGNLHLQPDPANAGAYLNIYLTAGPDIHISGGSGYGGAVILGTDEEANVALLPGGNVAIQAGNVSGTQTWTFDTTGDINIPPNANSSASGRIQSANGYPTLLAYGTGSHGGPELAWADTDDVNDLGNANILRNAMYINESGLWVGMNENNVANTFTGFWNFTPNGTIIFPTLEVDLHNNGVQTGQVLQFGNASQQAIITGPTPSANNAAERLIIQGQRGNGTGGGGEVYVWAGDADTAGGNIEIYAGDAVNVSTGNGGYVSLAGGHGFDNGGHTSLNGGESVNGTGGYVTVIGGYGELEGGSASLQGGYGANGQGGAVQIAGGGGNSQATYGNVEIGSGTYAWLFDNTGNLRLPGNTFAVNYANGTQVSIGGGGNTGNVTFSDQVVVGTGDLIGGGGLYLAPGPNSTANLQFLRVRGGDVASHIHFDTGNSDYYDLYIGDDSRSVKIANTGNIDINTSDYSGNSAQWTFGINGNLTLPGNLVIAGNANVFGIDAALIQQNDGLPIVVSSSGANGAVATYWVEDVGNVGTSNIAAVYIRPTLGANIVRIAVGQNGSPGPNLWDFNANGILSVPGNINSSGDSSASPSLNDFFSITSAANFAIVTDNANTDKTWNFDSTGNLTLPANAFAINYANGTQVSLGGNSSSITNGNSNVNIATANGNVTITAVGNTTMTITDTGANITGTANISGNANVANIGSTDGVFTGNISGNTNGFAIGYLNIPQVAAANATLALTDAGKHYYSTSAGNFTLTVPNNTSVTFATGTAISIVVQSAGNVLVNASSGVTLYMAGNSSAANRVVSNYGMATLMKVATNTWMINGTGVA
jgi:hypothetical protein